MRGPPKKFSFPAGFGKKKCGSFVARGPRQKPGLPPSLCAVHHSSPSATGGSCYSTGHCIYLGPAGRTPKPAGAVEVNAIRSGGRTPPQADRRTAMAGATADLRGALHDRNRSPRHCTSDSDRRSTPGLFFTCSYNHARRLRLEKLSHIEILRRPSGGVFRSETAVTWAFQKRNGAVFALKGARSKRSETRARNNRPD